jgi:hypothetical protein
MEKNSHSKYCNKTNKRKRPKGNEVHNTGNVFFDFNSGTGAVNNGTLLNNAEPMV